MWSESCSVVSNSLQPHGLHSPWNSTGQNIGVGSLYLLQGIFPTQGSNSGLLHCRQILYQLSHKGSPRTLEWVAYPLSSGSSQPRNRTGVSCVAGRFFTNWTIREALWDMLIGKYFLYTKQGHNKYWLSLLLPGFLHRLIFFPHSFCMFCFSGIQLEMGKAGGTTTWERSNKCFPSVDLWMILAMFQGFQDNLFNPFFWE